MRPENQHQRPAPVDRTVNGKAEVVAQDAPAHRQLPDRATRAHREESVAAIREGLAQVKAGRTRPARAALRKLAEKYGMSVLGE